MEIDLAEVVAGSAQKRKAFAVAGTALRRDVYLLRTADVAGGQGVGFQHSGRGALEHDLAAFSSGLRPDIDDIVGLDHHVAVVFNDNNRVACVAQFFQRRNQALVVALMQADARLVEDIEDVDQLGADLRCKAYTLAFAAGKRRRPAVERKVRQADVDEETQAGTYLLQDFAGDNPLGRAKAVFDGLGPFIQVADIEAAQLGDIFVVDKEMERLAVQTLTLTFRTGDAREELSAPFSGGGAGVFVLLQFDIFYQTFVLGKIVGRRHCRVFQRQAFVGAVEDIIDCLFGERGYRILD